MSLKSKIFVLNIFHYEVSNMKVEQNISIVTKKMPLTKYNKTRFWKTSW